MTEQGWVLLAGFTVMFAGGWLMGWSRGLRSPYRKHGGTR